MLSRIERASESLKRHKEHWIKKYETSGTTPSAADLETYKQFSHVYCIQVTV